MLANLGMHFASIMSKEYADQLAASGNMADLSTKPVGTGPFQFVDYQLDAVIRYAAHPDYFKGKEKIDDLVFAITPDPTARVQKVLAGECDVAPYPNPADIAMLKANKDITLLEQAGLNVGYMSYNTTIPPLDKPEVRHAQPSRRSTGTLIKAVPGCGATPAHNLIPPTMWSWNKDVKFDPMIRKPPRRYLPTPVSRKSSFGLRSRSSLQPELPARRRADPGRLGKGRGAPPRSSTTNGPSIAGRKEEGRPGAFQIGWTGDNGDPDTLRNPLLLLGLSASRTIRAGATRTSRTSSRKPRRPATRTSAPSSTSRRKWCSRSQAPAFLLVHSQVYSVVRKNVSGYMMDPLGIHRFDGVDKAE